MSADSLSEWQEKEAKDEKEAKATDVKVKVKREEREIVSGRGVTVRRGDEATVPAQQTCFEN